MALIAITAVGRDRPGIVAAFSGALYGLGANLEDTTMTRLGDQFAMILLAQVPGDVPEAELERTLRDTAAVLGLSLVLQPAEETVRSPAAGLLPGSRYMLRVYGADHPGIVHAVTSLLAGRACNISDLNTRVLTAGDRPVYVLLLEVDAPDRKVASELGPELERLGRELAVEVSWCELDEEAL